MTHRPSIRSGAPVPARNRLALTAAVALATTVGCVGCASETPFSPLDLAPDAAPLDNSDSDAAPASCADPGAICVTLLAPADFPDTAKTLATGFYKQLPPAGPPDIYGVLIHTPAIGPDTPLPVLHTNVTARGDFFFVAALFMEGGGTSIPAQGVDYWVESETKVSLDGSPLDLGALTLELFPYPTGSLATTSDL